MKTVSTNTNKGKPSPETGCGILGRYPVISVVTFAAIGLVTGIGLSFWDPDDESSGQTNKKALLQWIGLIGDLFIRSLTCIVLPMVFVTVSLSMVDMVNAGKASTIGYKTIGMYLLTTVIAAVLGLISTMAYKQYFKEGEITYAGPAYISVGCNNPGSFFVESEDGSVNCSTDYTEQSSQFILFDISGTLVTKDGGVQDDLSMSDTIYEGVFMKLATKNILSSFTEGNFAAVVFFAIFLVFQLRRRWFWKRMKKEGLVRNFRS